MSGAARRGSLQDWWALTKPRLNFLVLLSALAGYALAPGAAPRSPLLLFAGAFWLLAASSAALNMWLERETDALMRRTRERPLAAGRLSPRPAFWLGQLLALASLACFAAAGDLLTAGLGLLSWASYLLVYTPLKRLSPLSLLAGAVPGALPPVMGWTAGGGELDKRALGLFCLLFVWQIPHFLAIAALYAEDYAAAGLKVLGLVHGPEAAARQALVYAAALAPLSWWLYHLGLGSGLYLAFALPLSLAFAAMAAWAAWRPGRASARALLLGSVFYLPLLLAALVAGKAA